MSVSSEPETLHLPRILCFHGAGLSAKVFRLQMRLFITKLAPHFRLVFVDGPLESEIHPEVRVVYDNMGPYHRWFRWEPHHPHTDRESAIEDIEDNIMSAMANDPGTGEWVGLLGFSQGATLAASILLENQLRQKNGHHRGFAGEWFKFGILLAGYAPPCSLSSLTATSQFFSDPGTIIIPPEETGGEIPTPGYFAEKLKTPTFHVHGLKDPGLKYHRQLYQDYCAPHCAALYEWNDGHRIPYKTADVKAVMNGILAAAEASKPRKRLVAFLPTPEDSGDEAAPGFC